MESTTSENPWHGYSAGQRSFGKEFIVINLVLGILLIIVGIWGIVCNGWLFWDVLTVFFFFSLIGFGVVAILAGIRKSRNVRDSN